jgi:hypothetical protein
MPPRFLRSPSRGGFSYAANVGELEFSEVRRRCRLSLISLNPTLKRWPFAVTRTTEEIRADTI